MPVSHLCLLVKVSTSLVHFFLFVSWVLSFLSSSYRLGINPLSNDEFANIYSQSVAYLSFFKKISIDFMLYVLLACMSVGHLCTWCRGRPESIPWDCSYRGV